MNSNKKYDFYKNAIYYLIASGVMVVGGVVVLAILGFNYDASIKAGNLLLSASLSVILSSLAIFIYVGLRYGFAKAFSVILTITHNVLLSTALICIIRIPVSESLIMGYILLEGLSTIYTLILIEKLKDVNLKKADYSAVIKDSIAVSIKQITILSLIVIAMLLLALVIASESMFDLVREFFVMMAVIIYSTLTISLPLWCFFASKIKKINKAKVDEGVENQKIVKAVKNESGDEIGTATIEEEHSEPISEEQAK